MNKKSFLIVGHTGFIGQKLLEKLKKKRKKIYLVSKKIDKKNGKNINEFEHDVFSDFSWFKYLKNNMTVFFLAFNNDLYNLEKNKDYILKIFNFSIKFNEYLNNKNIKINLIFTSTATIYGVTNNNQIVSEHCVDNPISIYDQSKLCFENIFKIYSKKNKINFVSLRLTNIYGHHSKKKQINRGFLNKLITKSINNEVITIVGDGKNLRSYVYIDDLINAIELSSKKINKLNSKNFLICNDESNSFNQIIRIISLALKKKIRVKKVKYVENMHEIEKRSFVGNNDLFKKKTGWKPKIKLKIGIKKILQKKFELNNENNC